MIPPTILSVAALAAARAAKISGPPQHRTGRISNKRAAPGPFFSAGPACAGSAPVCTFARTRACIRWCHVRNGHALPPSCHSITMS